MREKRGYGGGGQGTPSGRRPTERLCGGAPPPREPERLSRTGRPRSPPGLLYRDLYIVHASTTVLSNPVPLQLVRKWLDPPEWEAGSERRACTPAAQRLGSVTLVTQSTLDAHGQQVTVDRGMTMPRENPTPRSPTTGQLPEPPCSLERGSHERPQSPSCMSFVMQPLTRPDSPI